MTERTKARVPSAGISIRVDSTLPRRERDWAVGFVRFLRMHYTFDAPLRIRIVDAHRVVDGVGEEWAILAYYPVDGAVGRVDVLIAAGEWNRLRGDDLIDARWAVLLTIAHQVKHFFQWRRGLRHDCSLAQTWGEAALEAYITETDPPAPWRGARREVED